MAPGQELVLQLAQPSGRRSRAQGAYRVARRLDDWDVHEFTKDAPTGRPSERRKEFTAIFCGARLAALRYPANYELYYYKPTNDPGFTLPKSFQGTSGGAVWRFYVAEKDGSIDVVDRRLIAVPFYESFSSSGKREITCHGPKGIYGAFIDAITEKWPKETKAGRD
jgi:hypothetical protein